MTDMPGMIPEWASEVARGGGVHNVPSDMSQWAGLSEEMRKQLSEQLLESILSQVVRALTGIFIPGPFGSAFKQLSDWVGHFLWWLELDELTACVHSQIGHLLSIDWTRPAAIWQALNDAWGFWKCLGRWVMKVITNLTQVNLGAQKDFLGAFVGLFALDQLQAVWTQFLRDWHGDDSNSRFTWGFPVTFAGDGLGPPEGHHPRWMILIDLVQGIGGWLATVLHNFTGINLPNWFEVDQFKACWLAFNDSWGEVNWLLPNGLFKGLGSLVTMGRCLSHWVAAVFTNITGVNFESILTALALDDVTACINTFLDTCGALNWSLPSAPFTALGAAVRLVRCLASWVITVLENLTGIDLSGVATALALDDIAACITTFLDAWAGIVFTDLGAVIHTAWTTLLNLGQCSWAWARTVIYNLTGVTLPDFFAIEQFKACWGTFNTDWAGAISGGFTPAALWDGLRAVIRLVRCNIHWALTVVKNITGADLETLGEAFDIDGLAACFATCGTALQAISWTDPAALIDAFGAVIGLIKCVGLWVLEVVHNLLDWDMTIVHNAFSGFEQFLEMCIRFWFGDAGVTAWQDFLAIFGGVEATLMDAIRAVSNFFNDLPSFSTLPQWIEHNVTLPLLAAFKVPDLGALGAQISKFLTKDSPINAAHLFGTLSAAVNAVIPVSNIVDAVDAAEEMLAHAGFDLENALKDVVGWARHLITDLTGAVAAAVVTATGSLKELFSRQAIPVTPGATVNLSAAVKTSGYTGSGSPIALTIVPFIGTAAQTVVEIATRGAATSWATLSGAYTVPSGVTSIIVRLAVKSGMTAGTVSWAKISASKSGNLAQTLVQDLRLAWGNLVAGANGVGGAIARDFTDAFTALTGLHLTATGAASTAASAATDAAAASADAASAAADAGTAITGVTDISTAAYNAWYGSGGTGVPTQVGDAIQAIRSTMFGAWNLTVITSNTTWTRPVPTSQIAEFWVLLWAGGSGGGKGDIGNTVGTIYRGGWGGPHGNFLGQQIDPASVPSSAAVWIGSGGSPSSVVGQSDDAQINGTDTSFGYITTTGIRGSIGDVVAFRSAIESASADGGAGGSGWNTGSRTGYDGGTTPLALGGAGGASGGSAGSAGGDATLSGAYRAGGGGGGGGGGRNGGSGGAGGNGGWPGGGGGGGGGAYSLTGGPVGGTGGYGSYGGVLVLWREVA